MLIPKVVCLNTWRMLSFQNPFSAISSLLLNLASPAVEEAHLPEPKVVPTSKLNFDTNKIVIEPAHLNVADEIQTFLHTHHFKSQPSIANLTKPLGRNFLDSLAERYSTTGDRWLAYQLEPRMRKRTIVGVLVGYKKFPWEAEQLEQWALWNPNPERYLAYFLAHCYNKSNLFTKYKIPYIYDIELLATSRQVKGFGVDDMLLRTAMLGIVESQHYPLIRILATDHFTREASVRAHMVHEWSEKLSAIGDENGVCMFQSENPVFDEMATADVYIRLMRPTHSIIY